MWRDICPDTKVLRPTGPGWPKNRTKPAVWASSYILELSQPMSSKGVPSNSYCDIRKTTWPSLQLLQETLTPVLLLLPQAGWWYIRTSPSKNNLSLLHPACLPLHLLNPNSQGEVQWDKEADGIKVSWPSWSCVAIRGVVGTLDFHFSFLVSGCATSPAQVDVSFWALSQMAEIGNGTTSPSSLCCHYDPIYIHLKYKVLESASVTIGTNEDMWDMWATSSQPSYQGEMKTDLRPHSSSHGSIHWKVIYTQTGEKWLWKSSLQVWCPRSLACVYAYLHRRFPWGRCRDFAESVVCPTSVQTTSDPPASSWLGLDLSETKF